MPFYSIDSLFYYPVKRTPRTTNEHAINSFSAPVVEISQSSSLPSLTESSPALNPLPSRAPLSSLIRSYTTSNTPTTPSTSPSSTAPAMATSADIIIVGAGLSGLQAALSAHQSGYSILVLEARDRVGGKTWSVPLASGRGCVDLGAAWINDTNQRRMWAYAQEFNLQMQKQNVVGDGVFEDVDHSVSRNAYGTCVKLEKADEENLERIRDQIQQLSVDAKAKGLSLQAEDRVTLAEYVESLGATDRTSRMVNLWARVMLGVEARECSARYFIDYCAKGGSLMTMRSDEKHGGQYLRFHEGSQSVAKGIAKLLPDESVRLKTAVKSIADLEGKVVVASTDGRVFTGKKVILSVPTPLYKNIEFSPPLPAEKTKAISSTKLGFYTKVILCYDKPWWTTKQLCGLSLSFHGPVIVSRDSSVAAKKQFSLTCFVNAGPGLAWSLLPAHERRARIIDHVWKLLGKDNCISKETVYSPIEVFEMQWSQEDWSEGAVCPVTMPGVLNESEEWMKRKVGNLHFVGTEMAAEWKGYMEGAVASGEVGAQEAVNALKDKARL